MIIDYSERRQVRRNSQKRPSVWPYVLVIFLFVVIAYVLGVGTGWYLFRPGGRLFKTSLIPPQGTAPKPLAPQQPQSTQPNPSQSQPSPSGQPAPASAPGQTPTPLPTGDKGAPVPLTFYKTLQKGNKELMGTGINQPKEPPAGSAKPASPAVTER